MKNSGIKIVISDLDGTLLNSDGKVTDKNLRLLVKLGKLNICRVVATGRSYYSIKRILPPDFPIDYLIFSSGAGMMEWKTKKIILAKSLMANQVNHIACKLIDLNFDFMIQHPIPDNHFFVYHLTGKYNPDFFNRIELYNEFARPLDGGPLRYYPACQIISIFPPEDTEFKNICREIKNFNIVRTTSPLDHKSIWIEIFPEDVSKSQTAAILCSRLGKGPENVLSIGNDFNDIDLLEWSCHAAVVANAPEELKKRFIVVKNNNESGFSDAIEKKIFCREAFEKKDSALKEF